MASAVIGIQLVTRVAVGSGTTRKESSSELSVTLKIHLEGREDNRSFGVHGFQTRFLFPHRNVAGGGGGRGREIRGAICHPPIVLPFEYEPYSYQSTNFVILGRFYFPPPEAGCGDAPRRQFANSYLTKSPFLRKLRYPSNMARDERPGPNFSATFGSSSIPDSDACPFSRLFFHASPSRLPSQHPAHGSRLSSLSRTVDLTKGN